MSEMTEARKAQMRALEQAATKGPWVAEPMWRRYGWKVWQHATMPPLDLAELHWESDAAFIAAARSFVPDALAHIERLEAHLAARVEIPCVKCGKPCEPAERRFPHPNQPPEFKCEFCVGSKLEPTS